MNTGVLWVRGNEQVGAPTAGVIYLHAERKRPRQEKALHAATNYALQELLPDGRDGNNVETHKQLGEYTTILSGKYQ